MSILRKRGKEKLRFRIMNKRVASRDFKYLKRLFLECLRENPDIAEQLDANYKLIQVCFFHESTDPNVENSLRTILHDQKIVCDGAPIPAFARSSMNVGCIVIFAKHLWESTRKREDIKDIEKYHKNGIFEELCHLVEQKGDSGIHPGGFGALLRRYIKRNQRRLGEEIILQLDKDRNHYEVYPMVIRAYPNDWINRYWRYFMEETSETYRQKYEQWKKALPADIVFSRLITDTLRRVSALYVAQKVPKEELQETNKKLLDTLIETGKHDIEAMKNLIEKEMGSAALILVDSLDESAFKTPEGFFAVVFDLWKSLSL